MRPVHWTAAVAAAAGALALAGAASGASTEAQRLVGCRGVTNFAVLFWPSGHGPIAGLRFPAFRLPHTEVFTQTRTGARQVGYLKIGGRGGPIARTGDCAVAPAGTRAPATTRVRRAAALFACRVPRAPRFQRGTGRGVATMTVTVPRGRTGLRIVMRAGRSVVSYDPASCQPHAPPR